MDAPLRRDEDGPTRPSSPPLPADGDLDADLEGESPASRARVSDIGSFLTTLARPAVSPALRVHDRTHLEFAIDYALDAAPKGESDAKYVWEAYFFAPESLRLDSRTYGKDDVYEDLRTYVRFAVPSSSLRALCDAPLERLRAALADRKSPDRAIRELRLFACQVRAAGEETRHRIVAGFGRDGGSASDLARWTIAAERFLGDARVVTRQLRVVLATAEGAPEPLGTAVSWIDEDVSRLVESLAAALALHLRERGVTGSLVTAAETLAVDEARYRDQKGLEGVARVGMPRRRVEQIEFRRHVLKRFTSSVLWLAPEVRPAAEWATHIASAVAAALAMSFALMAALWNGNTATGDNVTRWALVAVVAYALKDRLKALLQARFAQVVSRRFPDRDWTIMDRERKVELGEMEERSGFVAAAETPEDVLAMRRSTRRHAFEEQARPETILFHKKLVTLHRDRIAASDDRFEALTEILRLDLRQWLVHTDDPKRRFAFADPDTGEVASASAPRVYNIAVVYRLQREGEPAEWHRSRVVVSRKGIRRVDTIC